MCSTSENTATIASGRQILTIEIYRGFSLPQIIALLNLHEALIEDDEIVAYTAPHADARYPLCRIIDGNGEPAGGPWSLFDATAPSACCGSGCAAGRNCGCNGCPCQGSCPCHN
jgi:hypothetical protein